MKKLQNRNVDLFIFSGQSNMQGQTEPLKDGDFEETREAFKYKHPSGRIYQPVRHPSGENYENQSLLAAHQNYGSLPPYFAKKYVKLGMIPLVVHAAKGATAINEWLPETQRYHDFIDKINGAASSIDKIDKEVNYNINHKVMLWCQGESDGICGTAKNEYKLRFLQFWDAVKRDTPITTCYIIRITVFSDIEKDALIMAAQEELGREQPDIFMLTRVTGNFSEKNGKLGGDSIPGSAYGHYTTAGLRELGEICAQRVFDHLYHGVIPPLEEEMFEFTKN
ncbi:MAG: sialate O-acetylesterase [Saccharofermentanales bacterium]